jgi:thioesterase domain-containing protein
MVALPWALQPLPEVVTAAIAEDAALEVIPLPAEALNGGGCAIAAMAAHVLERIERRAADGPLVLTGYSIAGIVAASVAAELAARGRTVERLVLIDADFGRHSLRRRMARRIGRLVRRRAAAAMAAQVGALVARARRSAMGWTPPRLAMPVVAVHSTDPGVVNAANWARWCDGPVRVERVAGGHLELIRNPAVSARVAMAIAGAAEVARAA